MERADVERLLARIWGLPLDSKLAALKETLAALREAGYEQAMVFTQYTDTLDFLRDELRKGGALRLMCFSGRGGEIPAAGGAWRGIGRDDAKRRFRLGEADVLLCTDAAEGLNFQFCGALVNYDLPWNPMRVEQRIGRLDRLGQKHPVIRVVNLHYEGTVETDVYRALRNRIGLFETVVGRLQPILSRLPRAISDVVLAGGDDDRARRTEVVDAIDRQAHAAAAGGGFDIDTVLGEELAMPDRPPPLVTLDDLDRVIASDRLMPPETDTQPMGHREYGMLGACATEKFGGNFPHIEEEYGSRLGTNLHINRLLDHFRGTVPTSAFRKRSAAQAPSARNEGTAAGHDRPCLLRGARGERRAVVAGQPAVPAARPPGVRGRAAPGHDVERAPGAVTMPDFRRYTPRPPRCGSRRRRG